MSLFIYTVNNKFIIVSVAHKINLTKRDYLTRTNDSFLLLRIKQISIDNMKDIKWYNLDNLGNIVENNYILRPLKEETGIYVYKLSRNGSERYYIGSSINIKRRFRQHRYLESLHRKYDRKNVLFYSYVCFYGWNKFQFGVIKQLNMDFLGKEEKRYALLKCEHYYINKYFSNFNLYKTSKSLNQKQYEKEKIEAKLISNYSKKVWEQENISIKPGFSKETIIKQKLHNKEITVYMYDKNSKLIKKFDRIMKAAQFLGVSNSTISNHIKYNTLHQEAYYFKLKVDPLITPNLYFPLNSEDPTMTSCIFPVKRNKNNYIVGVYYKNKLVYQFQSIRQAAKYLNISKNTVSKYVTENKVWNNSYLFKRI